MSLISDHNRSDGKMGAATSGFWMFWGTNSFRIPPGVMLDEQTPIEGPLSLRRSKIDARSPEKKTAQITHGIDVKWRLL